MKNSLRFPLFLLPVLGILYRITSTAAVTTNDLKADWSETQNPNGVWSYRHGSALLPRTGCWSTNCGSSELTNCQPAWASGDVCPTSGGNSPILPAVFKVAPNNWNRDFQTGDIVMHSWDPDNGGTNGEGNITWTAPNASFVTISGGVWEASFLGRGNHWSLFHNATLLTEGDIYDGDAYSRATPFDLALGSGGIAVLRNIAVNQGDVIKLQITKTSFYGDMAGVNLKVVASDQPIGGPALRLQLNPGILVYGIVGQNYRIEYVSQAGATNWTTLTTVVLPSSPYLVVDPQPAAGGSRFYRAVVVP